MNNERLFTLVACLVLLIGLIVASGNAREVFSLGSFDRQAAAPAAAMGARYGSPAASSTYSYITVRNADPCTLNKLGKRGWGEVQVGGFLEQAAGSDENCENPGIYDTLDWILLEGTSLSTTTYQYKLLKSADPCSLNKFGRQGWVTIEYGGDLLQSAGSDSNCQNAGIYDSLDWTLMTKPSNSTSTYQYLLVRDADPCTLTKLGGSNWNLVATQGEIEPSSGADQNCLNAGTYLDQVWALFIRQ